GHALETLIRIESFTLFCLPSMLCAPVYASVTNTTTKWSASIDCCTCFRGKFYLFIYLSIYLFIFLAFSIAFSFLLFRTFLQ
ncbi:MAG: hypothetical protein EOO06_20350, partial [Chitinophagaceae bacterium]